MDTNYRVLELYGLQYEWDTFVHTICVQDGRCFGLVQLLELMIQTWPSTMNRSTPPQR